MEAVLPPDEDFAPGTPCEVEEHNLDTGEEKESYDYDTSEMSLEVQGSTSPESLPPASGVDPYLVLKSSCTRK